MYNLLETDVRLTSYCWVLLLFLFYVPLNPDLNIHEFIPIFIGSLKKENMFGGLL